MARLKYIDVSGYLERKGYEVEKVSGGYRSNGHRFKTLDELQTWAYGLPVNEGALEDEEEPEEDEEDLEVNYAGFQFYVSRTENGYSIYSTSETGINSHKDFASADEAEAAGRKLIQSRIAEPNEKAYTYRGLDYTTLRNDDGEYSYHVTEVPMLNIDWAFVTENIAIRKAERAIAEYLDEMERGNDEGEEPEEDFSEDMIEYKGRIIQIDCLTATSYTYAIDGEYPEFYLNSYEAALTEAKQEIDTLEEEPTTNEAIGGWVDDVCAAIESKNYTYARELWELIPEMVRSECHDYLKERFPDNGHVDSMVIKLIDSFSKKVGTMRYLPRMPENCGEYLFRLQSSKTVYGLYHSFGYPYDRHIQVYDYSTKDVYYIHEQEIIGYYEV